eukprot:3720262-Amphidinium_carterae.1
MSNCQHSVRLQFCVLRQEDFAQLIRHTLIASCLLSQGTEHSEDGEDLALNATWDGRRMQLTTAWRNAILNRHNEYRRETTDPCTATNMVRLEWDDTLQTRAQEYSAGWHCRDRLRKHHNSSRENCCINANDPNNEQNDWGENLGMSYVQTGDPPEITQAEILRLIGTWYNEIMDVEG